jgi:uncharacterized protein (TIGR02453 family)
VSFDGFSKEGTRFFVELARRQDRDWFKAHKEDFESLWMAPLRELLAELQPVVARAYRGSKLKPPKIFRIYRDVRFSKDKSPFKTNVAAMIGLQGGGSDSEEMGGPAALYMHLGLEDIFAAGHWAFSPAQLARFRKLVDEKKTGADLAKRVGALEKMGFTVSAFETLKRVPAGLDPEHPRAPLLKNKGLGLTFPKVDAAVHRSPKLLPWLASRIEESAPVVSWLERALRAADL